MEFYAVLLILRGMDTLLSPLTASHNNYCLLCHLLVILKVIFANSVDSDQTALGAVSSVSTLFACMQK